MVKIKNLIKSDLYKDIALVPHMVTVTKHDNAGNVETDNPDEFLDKVVLDFMRIPMSVRTRKHNKVYTIHKRFEDGNYYFEPCPNNVMALSAVRKGVRDCEGMMLVEHHTDSHESYGIILLERVKLAD